MLSSESTERGHQREQGRRRDESAVGHVEHCRVVCHTLSYITGVEGINGSKEKKDDLKLGGGTTKEFEG